MTITLRLVALPALLAASLFALTFRAETNEPLAWNKKAAASYLDDRQTWWMNWPAAARLSAICHQGSGVMFNVQTIL